MYIGNGNNCPYPGKEGKYVKRALAMCCCLCVLLCALPARAEFDFTPYELQEPSSHGFEMLDEQNLAAVLYLKYNTASLVWWRRGEIYREAECQGSRCVLIPRWNGSCGVVKLERNGGSDSSQTRFIARPPDGWRVTLYDWEDDGLTNGRLLGEGVIAGSGVRNGVALLMQEENETVLCLYDGNGNLEAKLPMEAEDECLYAARDREGMWIVTVAPRALVSTYRHMMIRNGEIKWQKGPDDTAYALQMDQQGGYFLNRSANDSTYTPKIIEHYNGDGQLLWRKTLSGDRVLLSTRAWIDPETGHVVIYGHAVAKSRGIFRVFRLKADENGNQMSLDVRECDYRQSYDMNVVVSPATGRAMVVVTPLDNAPSVFVPFDVLPPAPDTGLRLK